MNVQAFFQDIEGLIYDDKQSSHRSYREAAEAEEAITLCSSCQIPQRSSMCEL
jgi:hypothetical protein